jgi:hypothetical protein
MALCFGGGLWLAEKHAWLQALCRVSRKSHGSVYYPFAIAFLFHLTREQYALYVSAVLVLTVADTAAALIGSRFGRIRYRIGDISDCKSLEGSLAFYALAMLAVVLPLSFSDAHIAVVNVWLSAFLVAMLLTLVEAVSLGGRDNLYVPLLAAFMLLKTVTKSTPELIMQSISLVVLSSILPLVNVYGHVLRTKTVLVMGIVLYGLWSLGSVDWAMPMLFAILYFLAVFVATGGELHRVRLHRRMIWLSSPAVALMLLANLTGLYVFLYGPYLIAVLTGVLFGVLHQLQPADCSKRFYWSRKQLMGALLAVVVVLSEPVFMQRFGDAKSALWLIVLSLVVVWLVHGCLRLRLGPRPLGLVVVMLAIVGAMIAVALGQHYQVLGTWRPLLWADVYGRDVDALWPLTLRYGQD